MANITTSKTTRTITRTSPFRSFIDRVVRWDAGYRDTARMQELTDDQLRDIGLTREDIRQMARGR